MFNMSYCRFQNTFIALQECWDAITYDKELSTEEKAARKNLINLCVDIALDFGTEIDREVVER